jgi:hypothetical protein
VDSPLSGTLDPRLHQISDTQEITDAENSSKTLELVRALSGQPVEIGENKKVDIK